MRVPASTYRLQITPQFHLHRATEVLPYLRDLGVDWVYLSPLLTAEPGSDHGYDVVDHAAVDPARGGAAGLKALSAEARRLGLGVLVDIVPNHVGITTPAANPWWWDVLTHGRGSAYAPAFDIDWDAGRLLVPVVGDDDVLEDGRLANLALVDGELRYHDQRFPVAPGTAADGDDPNDVHDRQHYVLTPWREGDERLNYRRFFTVTTLAGVRVEEPEWFDRSHTEIRRWFDEGLVDGLRIDHPDGLRDPAAYLEDLSRLTGGAYVLVEKILEPGEELPSSWATAGTTGYDVLGLLDRLLTDPAGQPPLDALQVRLQGGQAADWSAMVLERKRAVADGPLRAEVRRIVRDLGPAEDGNAVPEDALEDAVAELLACFPVYRSYLPEGREHLEHAFTMARVRRPDLAEALTRLEPVLHDPTAPAALRFQQTSGMVMAKGVEDCAFYRWPRLTSLTEVGGDPSVFALAPEAFHAAMADRLESWPHAMTATTTHDTKRSEDVRARIAVLAEIPGVWSEALTRLLELAPVPDPAFGSLLWQAVLGAWPADRERLRDYALKAMREAGASTSWTDPASGYEAAVLAAVDAVFDRPEVRAVLDDLVEHVGDPGWSNALALKLLALTVPGVPDVYQGSETWQLSLVDPDNRRPVDYARHRALLQQVRETTPGPPRGVEDDGAAKLWLTHQALTARRDRPDLFTGYTPLSALGAAAGHVVAVDRGGMIPVATRLPVGLAALGGWGDTVLPLPPGIWRDRLTGADWRGDVLLADLLATYPVALLERTDTPQSGPAARGRFDVWGPRPIALTLSVGDDEVPMTKGPDDWWSPDGDTPDGEVDYGYRVDGAEQVVPDPRSRRQPAGVHGRSRTYDPTTFAWTDGGWAGRQLAGSVVYELHVGTFTPEGTLDAAVGRLDHLKRLGVDLVELMPVNAFNGPHGWGYDGVLWSAVHETYGGPAAYQRFVDACHGLGLGVIQDVVHNHFGPSGNYLPLFGPYLSEEGASPWGAHVNLDGPGSEGVRAHILDSIRTFLIDYHVDGLRLDAVHALVDGSEPHLLEEISALAAELSAQLRRPLTVIAESDLNDTRLVTPREAGGLGLDAQWSDDFHHALHVALTGETSGYYADFAPLSALAKVCERGFFHDGTWSSFRGRDHGRPVDVDRMPAWRLVVCNQNHDQVGNRAAGDRLTAHLDEDQLGLAALLTLAGPFTPMLFQGEEWAASAPFQFFTSHPEADLGRAVSLGRVREFERMDWDTDAVPDPQDPATFERSRLDWSEVSEGRHARLLTAYRDLIDLRRRLPELTDPDLRRVRCSADEQARTFVMWRGPEVAVVANFGDDVAVVDLGPQLGGDPGADRAHPGQAHPGQAHPAVLWTTASGATVSGRRLTLPPHAGALLRR